jgi:hypothetical protein
MENTNTTTDLLALSVDIALRNWISQNNRVNELLTSLSEEDLRKPTAPGRNSGVYLVGHLAAVNDGLLPLFGLGQKLHPELEKTFLSSPESATPEKPSIAELRKKWSEINETLTNHFKKMKPEDWFTRHNSVSEADFEKEPHRNKLNVLINRTAHQSYHIGQLVYLKKGKVND